MCKLCEDIVCFSALVKYTLDGSDKDVRYAAVAG
jgi:hypothetical protein